MKLPLFPLNTLVCPGGKLPLRIFEARYLDMVSNCLKDGSSFVVVMLIEGEEVDRHTDTVLGNPADGVRFYGLGTQNKIIDFDAGTPGVLNIVCEGQERVEIQGAERDENGLWWGECQEVDSEPWLPYPEEYQELCDVLKALEQHPMVKNLGMEIDYDDCRQVGWRLTELLPMTNQQKQFLLELHDPIYRLEKISDHLAAFSS